MLGRTAGCDDGCVDGCINGCSEVELKAGQMAVRWEPLEVEKWVAVWVGKLAELTAAN